MNICLTFVNFMKLLSNQSFSMKISIQKFQRVVNSSLKPTRRLEKFIKKNSVVADQKLLKNTPK